MASFSFALSALCILAISALVSSQCVLDGTASWQVTNTGSLSYNVGACPNPTFKLHVGTEYTWNISATGHPFWIKTAQGTGTSNALAFVNNNGVDNGAVKFTPLIPNAGKTYYYNSENDASMTGQIIVVSGSVGLGSLLGVALLSLSLMATLF